MHLNEAPFRLMQSGMKTVEVRLHDEKRRRLQVGDIIEFECVDCPTQRLRVVVKRLRSYGSFRDFYRDVPPDHLGEPGTTVDEMVARPLRIYSEEEERRFGAFAITVELLAADGSRRQESSCASGL
jgi:ASC-1-like (ASCH) protein